MIAAGAAGCPAGAPATTTLPTLAVSFGADGVGLAAGFVGFGAGFAVGLGFDATRVGAERRRVREESLATRLGAADGARAMVESVVAGRRDGASETVGAGLVAGFRGVGVDAGAGVRQADKSKTAAIPKCP